MGIHQSLTKFGLQNRLYSLAEWQQIERRTDEKFEYHDGRLLPVRAMAGGTLAHSLISGNMIYALGAAVRETSKRRLQGEFCGVHTSDLQIQIAATKSYLYPDAAVICGEPVFDPVVKTAAQNPILIVEVLSSSSVHYDTGRKFEYYSSLDSLREYVLVAQEDYWVEVRTRSEPGGAWTIAFAKTLAEAVYLPTLGLQLPMQEIYRGVKLPDEDEDLDSLFLVNESV